MSLATDLMGLGLPGRLAARVAVGGTGPLLIVGAGTTYATGTLIKKEQRFVYANTSAAGSVVSLPVVSGDCLLSDMYVINNSGTDSIIVFGSSGVIVSAGDSTSKISVQPTKTLVVFPVTTALWVGGILA